jgi:raffinose/stachyose/melibiose transport system substrate-binding protein
MKKLISMALCLALLLALPAAALAGEAVNLTMFTWCYPQGDEMEAMIADFEAQNPGVTLDIQTHSGVDEYLQAQKIRLLSGESIDLTSLRPETVADYVEAGYIRDITGADFLSAYTQDQLANLTYDGRVYGIPGAVNLIACLYNKDMFAEYGVEVPKTWDEFIAVLDTFLEAGIVPMANGGKDVWPMEFDIYPFIHSLYVNDPDIFGKLDRGEMAYTDEIWLDAFRDIEAFYQKGYILPDVLSLSMEDVVSMFGAGDFPILLHGEWACLTLPDADPAFEVGVFPFPYPNMGDETVIPITIGNYDVVAANSAHPEEAMKFLEFFSTPEGAQHVMNVRRVFTLIPVEGAEALGPYTGLWTGLLDMPFVDFFYSVQRPSANAAMLKGLQELFLGTIDAGQLAANVQEAQAK